MNNFTHRELIEGLLAGNELPRLPVAFWRHFPVDDQNPERLADASTHFQSTYDLDLIKVSPSSSFCIRDWGIEDVWSGNTEGTRDYLNSLPISEAVNIHVQDPKNGSLGKQLKALEIISRRHLKDTPIIQTIFSPLSQLKNLLGKQNLLAAIRHDASKVETILDVLTRTTEAFMESCLSINIDGFFFAVQHASSVVMSKEEFQNFGKKYDEKLFTQLTKAKVNILHVHGCDLYFKTILDYPCEIINWHDRECSPSLSQAKDQTEKILCGGLSRINTMVRGKTENIEQEISNAYAQMSSRSFLLGTGCVLPIITPHGNISFAARYARNL